MSNFFFTFLSWLDLELTGGYARWEHKKLPVVLCFVLFLHLSAPSLPCAGHSLCGLLYSFASFMVGGANDPRA